MGSKKDHSDQNQDSQADSQDDQDLGSDDDRNDQLHTPPDKGVPVISS
jgi:hypothetical protein